MPRARRTVIEYRNYELPPQFPIIVLTGEQWRISPTRAGHLHFHNCLEIGLCHEGSGTLELEDKQQPFRAGDVTCIARNVPHTTYSAPGTLSLWSYLFLQPHELLRSAFHQQLPDNQVFQTMLASCHLVLSEDSAPEYAATVRSILTEMMEKPPNYQLCVRAMCVSLLVRVLRVYDAERAKNMLGQRMECTIIIAPALDYIHENYMQDFPLDYLADVCHLSPTHFRRIFRELMHLSPLQFIHQTRILESCTLLRSTEDAIAAISEQVGFDSLSSFNRHFNEIMGCTPSHWRNSATPLRKPTILEFTGWTEAERS